MNLDVGIQLMNNLFELKGDETLNTNHLKICTSSENIKEDFYKKKKVVK
jgi:hypothetical protein